MFPSLFCLQVWFQNARAKWRRSVLRQQSSGPEVVKDPKPLSELTDLSCGTTSAGGILSSHRMTPETHPDDNEFSHADDSTDLQSSSDLTLDHQQHRQQGTPNPSLEDRENPFSHLNRNHHHLHGGNSNNSHHHHLHHHIISEDASPSFQSIHEELNHSIFNMIRPLQLF